MFSDWTLVPVAALGARESRKGGSLRIARIALAPGRRPLLDPREMVVVRETGGEFWEWARQIRRVLAGESVEERLEPSKMLFGERHDFLALSAGMSFFAA